MDMASLKQLTVSDHLSTIPHPRGNGHLICGIAAERRLSQLAEKALRNTNLTGRLAKGPLLRELKKEIANHFLREANPVDAKQCQYVANKAIQTAALAIVDTTHLIPCHLANDPVPHKISIGPVTFTKTSIALEEHKDSLQAFAKTDELSEKLSRHAFEYFEGFGWIAEVDVPGCDPKQSASKAAAMVQSALDCIHLMIGASHSSKMRVGGPNYFKDRRSTIAINSKGAANISVSLQSEGEHLVDDWWNLVLANGASALVELMGISISEVHLSQSPAPLAQRFIDASGWFGQGARDTHPASQLVKFVTAVERTVTTKDEKYLADRIAERGAALLCAGGIDGPNDRQLLKKVYTMRSKLLHGSRSPARLSLGEILYEAERLSRNILLSSLHFFGSKNLRLSKYSASQLDEEYLCLVDWAERRRKDGGAHIGSQLNFGS